MSSSLVPPQPPVKWDHSPESIRTTTKEAIDASRTRQDQIAVLEPSKASFQTVFQALAFSDAKLDLIMEPITFYQNVSPSKELRDASNEAENLIREFEIESTMRVDVYTMLQKAEENIKANGEYDKLSPEEKRLIEKTLLDGKRAGLALPEKEREEVKALKKELASTTLEFSKNFNEENGTIEFTLEELDGIPPDVISGYTKTTAEENLETKYKVTFKTPDIFPLFKYAKNPDTRRRAHQAFESRLEINVPLLTKAIALRTQIASILGYKTWADYVTEVKMIKTGDAVVDFLADLEQKLRPVGLKDYSTLLALKKEEHPDATEFYVWDYRYYDRLYIERSLDLDDLLIKEHFPVDVVVPTILKIYQEMLGVRFEEVKREDGDHLTWHPEVQLFGVWEQDAKDETGFLGYVYLDLFPREAKYSHAAVWPLIAGYTLEDGVSRNYPVCAMVANLAKPTPSKPAIMRHDDVVTFFHEMGHVFHGLLSRTRFSRFHGTSVARDFVEAPSQMLENWCWEPKVLQRMSSHYETKKPLSPELIEKLIQSRFVNAGLFNLRQLFFGNYDIKVHTDTAGDIKDYSKLWCELREKISLVKSGDKITPGQGTFGHIAGGYSAGYYGYLYSLVYAADMYLTVFSKDPMDPAAGRKYRDEILKPGGSRDEMDSLKAFLGRAPNSEAFLKHILGSASKSTEPKL